MIRREEAQKEVNSDDDYAVDDDNDDDYEDGDDNFLPTSHRAKFSVAMTIFC